MKRQQRRHLKENEIAHGLAAARDFLEARGNQLGRVVGAIVIVALIGLAIVFARQRSERAADRLLAEAMVTLNAEVIGRGAGDEDLPPSAAIGATGSFATEAAKLRAAVPKLRAAADAYPDKEAGIIARYHLAGALAALGQNDEAAKEFATVAEKAGRDSLYGRMARLGRADSLARAGQLDEAIESWKQLAAAEDAGLPKDAILMELARAYAAKGNTDEARKTLNELVAQHPDSPYSPVARSELESLEG